MKKKRILIDMSATILHHGHIRLINKAKKFGKVIIGLTNDKDIKRIKGYAPEIKFKYRKEILENIKNVSQVIQSNFYIDEKYLKKNKIDYLVHGNDNKNNIKKNKIKIFSRTKNISSTIIRKKAAQIFKRKKYEKKSTIT